MKKYLVQEELLNLFSRFRYHEKVLDEIQKLIIDAGLAKPFIKMLQKRIDMIEKLGSNIVQLESFEKLTGIPDLYSMKFKGKDLNHRILFSYDDKSRTILLHCFYEKDDSGRTSYRSHIPIAVQRNKEMEEK